MTILNDTQHKEQMCETQQRLREQMCYIQQQTHEEQMYDSLQQTNEEQMYYTSQQTHEEQIYGTPRRTLEEQLTGSIPIDTGFIPLQNTIYIQLSESWERCESWKTDPEMD